MEKLAPTQEQTGDRRFGAVWAQIGRIVDALLRSPLAGGVLIDAEDGAVAGSGLAFTGGTARSIPHKLGRKARYCLEVYGADVPTAAHVGLRTTAHPTGISSETHVTVTPASTGTCFLVVF